ncbi:MAG TPA: glycosyltransferase family 4 protein [Acidobacteriota bacterium]|nr:glycosyltransferase family 4 protein [Acidobacteriota bacterium]
MSTECQRQGANNGMRILLFCYEYPPIGGGGGVGAQQYAEAWVRAGHEVTVVTSRAPGLAARELVGGVDVVRVFAGSRKDRATASFLSMALYNFTGALHLAANWRKLRRFELINTHFAIPSGPLGWLAAKAFRLPHVLTIIGGDIYDPSKRSSPHRFAALRVVNSWIMNSADRVIAISSDTRKRAEEHYRVRNKIEVINYGFTPLPPAEEIRLPEPLDPRCFYLIGVGRLVSRKGFDVAIRALRHLPDRIHLLLVGDGPLEKDLRLIAQREDVSDRVHFLGFLPRAEIQCLLRMSQCFVLSSWHEGLGIVVQEAMDAGLPVVATNNGGQVDLIRHGHNGFLVEPGDHLGLAEAVRTLYDEPALCEQMGQNNREEVRRLYMDENHALYLNVFNELALRPAEVGEKVEQVIPSGTELTGAGR